MYSVGELVWVRDDLEGGCYYKMQSGPEVGYDTFFNPDMKEYCGRESVIVDCDDAGYQLHGFGRWLFSDEMLDSAESPMHDVGDSALMRLLEV